MAGRGANGRFTAGGGGGAKVHVQVKDVDKGYAAFMKRVNDCKSATLVVGIMGDKGNEISKAEHGNGNPRGSRSLTVLDVATFHEFGLGVPERSFVRAWFDMFQPQARKMITVMLKSVIDGKRTKANALELLGVRFVGELQKFIVTGPFQALEPATIRAKGSSKPLIDTGQTKSAVTYRIELQDGQTGAPQGG